jgi:hypothetical protein
MRRLRRLCRLRRRARSGGSSPRVPALGRYRLRGLPFRGRLRERFRRGQRQNKQQQASAPQSSRQVLSFPLCEDEVLPRRSPPRLTEQLF